MTEGQSALPRELGDFLIEFAIGLNKHAIYPGGHPSLGPAVVRLFGRLTVVLGTRPGLNLGVARDRLVVDGLATEASNAVLRELADRLHRHHLSAVAFSPGVSVTEIADLLATLAIDPDRSGSPIGLAPDEDRSRWQGVRLHPVSYEELELAHGADATHDTVTSARLWVALAQAALRQDETSVDVADAPPRTLADAIAQRTQAEAYDRVIVEYMLKLSAELRSGQSPEGAEIRRRVSALVTELEPGVLDRLLTSAGSALKRRELLLTASETLALDAVLALVEAAARTDGDGISHGLLRMFEKLAVHAESGTPAQKQLADPQLREQITQLVTQWSLRDPTPAPYSRALTRMASDAGASHFGWRCRHEPEPLHLAQMALEIGVGGKVVADVAERLAESGELRALLDLLESAPPSEASSTFWEAVTRREVFEQLLHAVPIDTGTVDRLLDRLGIRAADPMLDALATSESSYTRRVLLDRLAGLGPSVASAAVARLAGAPWYVQRNMLRLLGDVGVCPDELDAEHYATVPDPRVRTEAIRLMIRSDTQRTRAIALALHDDDARVLETGLLAASEQCPDDVVPRLVTLATQHREPGTCILAVRALGASRHPLAVSTLLAVVRPRRLWLLARAPARTPLYLEALRALRAHRGHPEAEVALERALRSGEADLVEAASGGVRCP